MPLSKSSCLVIACVILMVSFRAVAWQGTINEVMLKANEDSIKSHIAFLSDDKLKGRMPGTPEYNLAVNYVIGKYRAWGLKPAGVHGSFLQQVLIRRGFIDNARSSMTVLSPQS